MITSKVKLKNQLIFDIKQMYDADDLLLESPDIVDIVCEQSKVQSIISTTILLSNSGILYVEYDLKSNKIVKSFLNNVLTSLITNTIVFAQLSLYTPILLVSSLNEILIINSKIKPQNILTLKEENVIISSMFVEGEINRVMFNNEQNLICILGNSSINVYSYIQDKENKNAYHLKKSCVIKENFIIDNLFEINFNNFISNSILIVAKEIDEIKDMKEIPFIDSLVIDDKLESVLISFKSYSILKNSLVENIICYAKINDGLIDLFFSSLYHKLVILYEKAIVIYDDKYFINEFEDLNFSEKNKVYKYSNFQSNISFINAFFNHNFQMIIAEDNIGRLFLFDVKLNLYKVIINSKIDLYFELQDRFSREKENVDSVTNEINPLIDPIKKYNHSIWEIKDEYSKIKSDKNSTTNINNTSNSNLINSIFLEEVLVFNKNQIFIIMINKQNTLESFYKNESNLKLKESIDFEEIRSFKTNLLNNCYETCIQVLNKISDTYTWIKFLLILIYKLCDSNRVISRKALNNLLESVNLKKVENQYTTMLESIKTTAFNNLLMRYLSNKEYDYAFLIANNLKYPYMYKSILSHSRQTNFLSIAYLCSSKLEEIQSENDDSIINDINKIFTNSNFSLTQNNLHNLLKDIDILLEMKNFENEYIKENNTMDLNLEDYINALDLEFNGHFKEAKEIYEKNNLKYDINRVEKLAKEIENSFKSDTIFELFDA